MGLLTRLKAIFCWTRSTPSSESQGIYPKKVYSRKQDIYEDFPIAVRLVLDNAVHPTEYDNLPALAAADEIKLEEFNKYVEGLHPTDEKSIGFFVTITVKNDAGEPIGTKFVLLGHETGPEVFLISAAIAAAAVWVADKVAGKALEKAIEPALDKLFNFLRVQFYGAIRGGIPIVHVEIRTKDKGILRMPFSFLQRGHLEWLIENFHKLTLLSDAVDPCFGEEGKNKVVFLAPKRKAKWGRKPT